MSLDPLHVDGICDDIIEQQCSGATTHALFMMKFTPDGKLENCTFSFENDTYIINEKLDVIKPVVLFLS